MVDLQKPLARAQTPYIAHMLGQFPVVVVTGARQTGKTTLIQLPEVAAGRVYRSLDDYDTLQTAQSDPVALWSGAEHVTLDEVQRVPDLLRLIKAEVDRRREPGHFLCTGSANLLLMRSVSESLAGRAAYVELPPLTWSELEGGRLGGGIELLLDAESADELVAGLGRLPTASPRRTVADAVFRGGLPVPALSADGSFRARWYDGYAATYLERDLRQLAAVHDLIAFRRVMQAVALRNGQLLNVASVAQDAGLAPTTVSRYLSLLETSCQIWRLPAYAVNRGKRLVKAPRLIWYDSGFAAHLAGFHEMESLTADRLWGAWLESWVGNHLHAYASLRAPRFSLCHWRTSSGREVDFVLERGRALTAIEVKATPRPSLRDTKGLQAFLELHQEARVGVLLCSCPAPMVLTRRIAAVPFEQLFLTADAG